MFNPQAHKERLTKKMVEHTQALQIAKVIPNLLASYYRMLIHL